MPLTEGEIIAKHAQCLGEADRACQALGRHADPDYFAPRGHQYAELKRALSALEGSARQMSMYRGDARWLRLGILYGGKVMRGAQKAFVGQRWKWFNDLRPLFQNGLRSMADLRDMKTGRASATPILPRNPSAFLWLPDHQVPQPPMPPRHAVN